MGVERGGAARERGLFEFLAASRPPRGWRESMAATVASVAGHAAVVGAAVASTLVASGVGSTVPPSLVEKLQLVELSSVAVALPGDRGSAGDAAPRAVEARMDVRTMTPGSLVRGRIGDRRLAALIPPAFVPEDIPVPTLAGTIATLYASEYDGLGRDSTLTAAAIFADHHQRTVDDLAQAAPSVEATPYTQAPELANTEEMKKVLSRKYPPFLRDEGIGGRVLIWFLVDEFGHARKWLLKQSSGQRALDRAAMNVAAQARFRPAMNYDRRVPVWVVLPVTFQVLEAS